MSPDSNARWLQPSDHAGPRFVRPVESAELARATRDDHLDLYMTLEEQQRIARVVADTERDIRVMRWQRRIKVASIVLACVTAIYFGLQLVRGI